MAEAENGSFAGGGSSATVSAPMGLPPLHTPEFDATRATSGGSVKTPNDWVQRELRLYRDHFTQIEPTKISMITFNVAEKKPGDVSFMIQNGDGSPDKDSDIISIGLQEVDMSASALMKEETEAAVPWVNALKETIGADTLKIGQTNKKYYPLGHKQMVGLLTCVFIKKELLQHMTDFAIGNIATGALGAVGNKGGVGMRFGLRMSTICIINCHLAAHQEKVEKRNQDIDQILRDCPFSIPPSASYPNGASFYPREHDIILVMGDLNYRVDLPYEEATRLTKFPAAQQKDAISQLLKHDQLVKEMRDQYSPWKGFTDCLPSWLPTYRFDKGTHQYDTSEKKRIPSYTDRILYFDKSRKIKNFSAPASSSNSSSAGGAAATGGIESEDKIVLNEAHSVWKTTLSDHKPVRGKLTLPVRKFVQEKRKEMHQALSHKVQELGLDKVMVARTAMPVTTLDFGNASYGTQVELSLPLENKGDCVAVVEVLRKGERDPSEASWLRVSPTRLELFPGEKTSIRVLCKMDRTALAWLAGVPPEEEHPLKQPDGRFKLTSFLCLAVASGSMHFVECSAVVQPSCFGSSLDNLIRFERNPCRVAYVPKVLESAGGGGDAAGAQGGGASGTRPPQYSQLPKELWYLCDYLYNYGNDTQGLFVEEGQPEELVRIRSHLDSEVGPFPAGFASPTSVAHALVIFLRDLQGSVVPQNQYFNALAAGRQGGKAPHSLVGSLPPVHCNVLVYTVSFLRYLLRHSDRNGLSEEVVSQAFAAILLQPPIDADLRGNVNSGIFSPDRGGLGGGDSSTTSGGGGHVDPMSGSAGGAQPQQRGLEVRAELAQRKQDAISFILSFFTETSGATQ